MGTSEYDGKMVAVASIQRQLDDHLTAIRGQRSFSDAGRKTEMAKSVLAARAQVDKMRSEFVAEREARRAGLSKIVFGSAHELKGSDVIVNRDAQDRAAQLASADDAQAMLHRADQNGDDSLARAVAQKAFNQGWLEVSRNYANKTGKSGALELLVDEAQNQPHNKIGDAVVFRIRNPEELSTASEPMLRKTAEVHAPGMGPSY
jgi:hypothetical protein